MQLWACTAEHRNCLGPWLPFQPHFFSALFFPQPHRLRFFCQGTQHERELAAGASRALRWADVLRPLRLCVRIQVSWMAACLLSYHASMSPAVCPGTWHTHFRTAAMNR